LRLLKATSGACRPAEGDEHSDEPVPFLNGFSAGVSKRAAVGGEECWFISALEQNLGFSRA